MSGGSEGQDDGCDSAARSERRRRRSGKRSGAGSGRDAGAREYQHRIQINTKTEAESDGKQTSTTEGERSGLGGVYDES